MQQIQQENCNGLFFLGFGSGSTFGSGSGTYSTILFCINSP